MPAIDFSKPFDLKPTTVEFLKPAFPKGTEGADGIASLQNEIVSAGFSMGDFYQKVAKFLKKNSKECQNNSDCANLILKDPTRNKALTVCDNRGNSNAVAKVSGMVVAAG